MGADDMEMRSGGKIPWGGKPISRYTENDSFVAQETDEGGCQMKGATQFDQLCHRVFSANGNGTNYLSRRTGVKCGFCGYEIEAYYCESRLYMVECHHCKTKALVMAGNPEEAASKTFGHVMGGGADA